MSTNNRSYRRSANSAQHVAIGQMRAAETGRPVVQAAISGISAVIDADGGVHAHTELFDRTVLEATVAATTRQTPYVRFGEWVVWRSLLALAGCVVVHVVRRRRAVRRLRGPSRGRAAGRRYRPETLHEPRRNLSRAAVRRARDDRERDNEPRADVAPRTRGRRARVRADSAPACTALDSGAGGRRHVRRARPGRGRPPPGTGVAPARATRGASGKVALTFGLPMVRKRAEQRVAQRATRPRACCRRDRRPRRRRRPRRSRPRRHRRRAGARTPRHPRSPTRVPPAAAANGARAATARAELPIPGYDALSASQVVERLAGLGRRRARRPSATYEAAHRNRRTILGKIEQLESPSA